MRRTRRMAKLKKISSGEETLNQSIVKQYKLVERLKKIA